MIRNTFLILDKFAEKKEKLIWAQKIDSWDKFIHALYIRGISKHKKPYFDRQLTKAKQALYNYNSSYFVDKLPSTQTWRLYGYFKQDAVFLDIESEGVGRNDDVTVIGLYDGLNTKTMIKDVNLDLSVLKKELVKYRLIVTFNGSSFDLPFIRKRYDILPNIPHIDLRYCCAKLGLTGGLKEIEKGFKIKRNRMITKFSGGDALTLWRMYKATGDCYYLDLLVEYNEEDIFNLKKIMNYCYQKLKEAIENEPKQRK